MIEMFIANSKENFITTENRQVIGQRMYTSLSFLQMGTAQLEDYMYALSMENPFLEGGSAQHEPRLVRAGAGKASASNGGKLEMPIPEKVYSTLKMALDEQLLTMKLEPRLEKAVKLLIVNLDDRGYLPKDISACPWWEKDEALFRAALDILQKMEPCGVGARDLSECLKIQLIAENEGGTLAYKICDGNLEHLAQNHINHLAKALGASRAEILAAKKKIAALNPRPSNGYDDGKSTIWTKPDVEVFFDGGELKVVPVENHALDYSLNKFYTDMADSEDLSDGDRRYFSEKIEQAKDAIRNIHNRADTMLACAKIIAEQQREFFAYGVGNIRPCTANDIANEMNVHPTTVTRAVKDKYLYCSWGIFPMSYFFMQDVNGVTAENITAEIKKIIAEEDPAHPFSDSTICEKLARNGFDVARRTVAKYRDIAGIPSAAGRRNV